MREFAYDCMQALMEQQQAVNQCIDSCVASVTALTRELETTREQNAELQTRVNATEDAADTAVEQSAEAMISAERLAFLSEQQVYDLEKQYHQQEKRLLEIQKAQVQLEKELQQRQQEMEQLRGQLQAEAQELELERVVPQWKPIPLNHIPVGESDAEENLDCDVAKIHTTLANWGENKAPGQVDRVEDWLEMVLSGKRVTMENDKNTIELCIFNLEQRDLFITNILPLIAQRKNLECFVQEHRRRESDFRITIMNTEEAIPAISVPQTPVAVELPVIEEKVSKNFVLVPSGSEEEEEEIRQSDLDAINKVVESQINQKERRRKMKMISLD